MASEEMQKKLYNIVSAEQERYRRWLLNQPPEVILSCACEYSIRESIVLMLKEDELPNATVGTLLKSRTPLADVFQQWRNHQAGYLEGIRDALERCENVISHEQREER